MARAIDSFDDFVVFHKTLELLDRYGINPKNVSLNTYVSRDGEQYHWRLSSHPNTPASDLEKLELLHKNLNIYESHGEIIVSEQAEVSDILYEAIERAPKSFTRYR